MQGGSLCCCVYVCTLMRSHTVKSRKETEVALLEEEAKNPEGKGLASAIIGALDVQVDQ